MTCGFISSVPGMLVHGPVHGMQGPFELQQSEAVTYLCRVSAGSTHQAENRKGRPLGLPG
jgi:hypothetical protein